MDKWKQRLGDSATYGKLITAFESVGCRAYADFVRRLANGIEIPADAVSDDGCHLSPPISPETCTQSLFLTNTADDNHKGIAAYVTLSEKNRHICQSMNFLVSYISQASLWS